MQSTDSESETRRRLEGHQVKSGVERQEHYAGSQRRPTQSGCRQWLHDEGYLEGDILALVDRCFDVQSLN